MTISLISTAAASPAASVSSTPSSAVGAEAGAGLTAAPGDATADASTQALFASLLGAEIDQLGQGAKPLAATGGSTTPDRAGASKTGDLTPSDPAALTATTPLMPDLAAQIMAQSAMVSAMQPPPPSSAPPPLAEPLPTGNATGDAMSALSGMRSDGADTLAATTLLTAGKLAGGKGDGKDDALQNLPAKAGGEQLLPFQDVQQQQLSASQSAGAQTAPTPLQAAAPATTFTVHTPVGDQTWSRQVGTQVLAMVSMKTDHAQIQVSPPELGPITVSLKIDGNANTAQVMFSADSAATREALQNSLPRLSEMMAASGLQLSDAQVSSQSQGQRQASGQQNKPGRRNDEAAPEEIDALTTTLRSQRMLSTYA